MRSSPIRYLSAFGGLLAGALAIAVGSGCSTEPKAPQQVVRKQAPKPEAKLPAALTTDNQVKKPELAAIYDPGGRRDPFLSFVRKEVRRKTQGFSELPPLQRYDLSELKFVGVIRTKKAVRALLEDGEGKGYSVTPGTRIGRSGGVVSRITDTEILVREEFVGYQGQKVVKETGIQLTTVGGKE